MHAAAHCRFGSYYTSVTVEFVCLCGVTLREASNFDSKGHVYIAHFLDNLHTLGI